jgi:hypothetical protein
LPARATVLPDACGDDKTNFQVTTQKDQPAPGAPEADKAQIVFIETVNKNTFFTLPITTRYGLDGAWVGANEGNSYFVVPVAPGVHHICADWQGAFNFNKKKTGLTSFTAEAGKTYYFQAEITVQAHQNDATHKSLELSGLNEDEGKYRIKISALSATKPAK